MANVYHVQNIVRRQGSRLLRAKSATRHRFKLFVAGRRLLRKKKMALTEEVYNANKAKIEELVKAGVIALILPDGIQVTALADGRFVHMKPSGAKKIVGDIPAPVPVEYPGGEKAEEAAKPELKKEEPKAEEKPVPKAKAAEAPKKAKPADDLTKLSHIGPSRVAKLKASKIFTFEGAHKFGAEKLAKLLDITVDTAEEVIMSAGILKG